MITKKYLMKVPADNSATDLNELVAEKSEFRAETPDDMENLRYILSVLILLEATCKELVRWIRMAMDEAKFSFFYVFWKTEVFSHTL